MNTITGNFCAFGTDNLSAFERAIADGVYDVPAGSFALSGLLEIRQTGAGLRGAGRELTSLYLIASITPTTPTYMFLLLHGDRNFIRGVRVGVIPSESRSLRGCPISLRGTNFDCSDNEINVPGQTYSSPEAGIAVGTMGSAHPASGPGLIAGNRILDTAGDGIFTACCRGVTVSDNYVANSGDDAISTHGLNRQASPDQSDTVIKGNTIMNSGSRGIALCGGRNTTVAGNTIETTFLAGILLDPTGVSTAGIHCAAITGNRILYAGLGTQPTYPRQSGGLPSGVPAGIILNADGTHVINDVAIVDNTVNSSKLAHLITQTTDASVSVTNIVIEGNIFEPTLLGNALSTGQVYPANFSS